MAALYREFEIDLDEVGIDDAILTTDHAIHKHIKQLIVVHRLMPFRKDPNYEVRWSEKLRLLLERLPRDKLESVCTPRSTELSQALLDLMFSRQRNLKYIQLGPGHKLQNISVPQLPRLEALEIPAHIGPLENLRFYQTLLSQNRNIKGLSVRAQHYDVRPGHTLPVDRGVEQPSNVFPRIFGHRPLELKRLLLCTQKLFDAETTLTPYIPFERLHELHFLDCDGIGQMLSLLGNRFKSTGSALQLLSLHAYTSNVVSNLDMAALEGFLESFKGLRFLEIRWDDIIRPDFHIRCLEGHMPTLTDLNLSFMKDEHRHKWFMNQHDVEKLFQMAPNLRQVALPLRDVNPYGRRGLSAVLD
ncbi:hypothetical protein PRZ48_003733 [Zasmidium cellare]|uniref:F-box domain-containing protein n=1 Tax=Zasmidium cellare TaxID=395010 RepID=A0ABR0EXH3_ZASCE|nr:hypothetical protein PRZ48_003733 [Zasmidium cellare]